MEQLSELKQKLLDMMVWFHSFCEEHGLRYYVLGGTMLGAVRHKGFIPWDDDIDVGMPRKDYEQLEKIMGNKLFGQYILETPSTIEKDYFYAFSKIYDTKTTLIENTKYKVKRGIYIDVFPLDGIGESKEAACENFRKIEKKINLLSLKTCGFRKGRKFYKNFGVAIFRLVPMNSKRILKSVCEECSKLPFDDSIYVGNLVGAWGFKEVMLRDIMGKPTLYDFEGIKIFGAEKSDEYLTSLYGDWRQLPPPEKRISHHDYVLCDLEKPYMEGEAVL